MRCVKFGAGGLFVFFLGAFFLFGTELTSMLQTSARSIQRSARESVPVEFELQRAKEKVNEILPDLQSQVRMIAEEEVAVAALTKEVQQDEKRLLAEEAKLADLRDEMRTTQVSFKINSRNLDRQQLAEHLKSRFDHFKQGQNSLHSKQRLLDKRKDGLNAALTMLDQMRTRQSELKLKVESLAAQHRLDQSQPNPNRNLGRQQPTLTSRPIAQPTGNSFDRRSARVGLSGGPLRPAR